MDYGNEEEASALREMAEGATRPSCGGSFRDRMLVWHHGNKWFRVMFRIDALSTPACGVLKEALGHGRARHQFGRVSEGVNARSVDLRGTARAIWWKCIFVR